VAPADYDDGNNDFAASIDIMDATQPFDRMQVVAMDSMIDYHERWTRRFERFGGGHAYQVEEQGRKSTDQHLSIYAEFAASVWDGDARLSFTQHLDGVPVGDVEVAVADLPQQFVGEGYRCASAPLGGQMTSICNSNGRSTMFFMRNAYDTVYVNRATVSGDVEWFAPAWDRSGSGADGVFRTLGTTYRGSARYTSAAGSRYGELTATLGAPVENGWNVDSTWTVVLPEGVLYNTYVGRSWSWNRSGVAMTGF
jgi:hypothetical protein